MLNRIIEFSIQNKLITGLFVLVLLFFGIFELTKLPIDAVPDITDNQVQVITQAPSLGALDIERLVTFPIEQSLNNINGLKEIRSFSRFGLSLVTVVFNDDVDVYWARQQVGERLNQTDVPKSVGTPMLGPISTGLGEIFQYVVRPKPGYEGKYDEISLRTIQDWVVRRQLLGVKGVAEVSSFGGKLKQYSVEILPEKLLSNGVDISEVYDALQANNENTGGAYIETGPTVLYIGSEGLIKNIDDINNIRIKSMSNGNPLLLKDIAEVKIGHAVRYGAMCYNGKNEVAGGVVMMLKGANSSEVINNVKERIAQIEKTLPEGILLEPFLDRSKMVNNAIGTVSKNLIEGALIVIFVLVLFLGNFRAGLLVASVIPLAMLFAVIMMNLFGVSGNLMSLGALDFGLIVDGAVIIVEAIMHQLVLHNVAIPGTLGLTQSQMDHTVQKSAGKMMNSAVFGQIIILVVYLPIFALEGIEGKMFKPMAQTVAFSLIGAFLLSLTYIPMMSALLLSKKRSHKQNWSDMAMAKVENAYSKALHFVLGVPKIVLSSIVLLFFVAVLVMSNLGGEFIPSLEEGDFAADTRVLTGSSLSNTIEQTNKAAQILVSRFPEVEKVVTKIGSGEVPTDPMPMEASDMMVILKDKHTWTSAKTFDALAEKMSTAISEVPGVSVGFQYPVQMRFNELMTGARQDVVCKLFGEDLDTLSVYAARMAELVGKVEGAQDIYVEKVAGLPQLKITYNRAALSLYEISVSDVNRVVNMAFAGQSTGALYEGERRFDIVLRLNELGKRNLQDAQQLLIPTGKGIQVPLSVLADVKIVDGPNQIQREDAKRRIIVGFNVRGRDVQSIVTELQGKVNTQIKLPAGYYYSYGGAFENLNAAKRKLMVVVPIALGLIFILLYFAFGSVLHSVLIYSAIPLSAIGGILFLAFRGMPFSISAGIGFIALFGVAVLNGIVLVTEFNHLKLKGGMDLKEVVMQGARLRLRPVLMTAFVASMGFLPMALSNGSGAEVQRPLATVVIGGLLVATLLTLFVLPILYVLLEKSISKRKGISLHGSTIVLLFCFLGLTNSTEAQQPISLADAQNLAIKQNLEHKSEALQIEYRKLLIGTYKSIAPTNFTIGLGQFNSYYFDTGLNVEQSFHLPVVYQRQKALLTSEYDLSRVEHDLHDLTINNAVEMCYFNMVYLKNKLALLKSTLGVYQGYLKKAEIRISAGESNVLEQSTTQLLIQQAEQQIENVVADYKTAELEFQWLLNAPSPLMPEENVNLFNSLTVQLSPTFSNHPIVLLQKQKQQVAAANIEIEKSKLLPGVSLALNNNSIRGVGADNRTYGAMHRFVSLQAGVSVPLFTSAQKAQIAAAEKSKSLVDNQILVEEQKLKVHYEQLLIAYSALKERLSMLENNNLKTAIQIQDVAQLQFDKGDIGFFEWLQSMHYAIAAQNEYIETLKSLNDTIIQLHFFVQD